MAQKKVSRQPEFVLPPPPLPSRLPLLGHSLALVRRRQDFFVDARAAGPVVTVHPGSRTLYLVNDLELARRILTTDASKYTRGELFERVRPYVGDSLPFVDGRPHRKQRRMIRPSLHRTAVAGYVDTMSGVANRRLGRWQDGDHVVVGEQFRNLAMEVVGSALFSFDFSESLLRDWHTITPWVPKGLFLRITAPYAWVERLPLPVNRRFVEATKWVRELCDRITDEHTGDATDLVSLLLDTVDPDTGEPVSKEQISTEVLGMLIAGTETIGSALSWCCMLLASHPDVQQRVRAEVDQVLAGRPCTAADLSALTYTRHVVTETLRLYPPLFFLTRTAREDVELGGFRIPAGSSLLLSPYALQRAPEYFPQPEKFAPDRWTQGGELSANPDAFLPFGAGLHRCLGEQLAMAEGVVILSTLLSRWELCPVNDETPRSRGVLLTPEPGRVVLRSRDVRFDSHRADSVLEERR
ncbi:cytochrome P450 [Streptomyces sp. NPDC048290]|uniref:cytochrome P450 n=1 Tax=Streptomyces sp. NPDC048290 TaxID=3155811 RepID=UPI003416B1EF